MVGRFLMVRRRSSRRCATPAPANTASACVAARVAEVVLRGERAIFLVGSHNVRYDVALSLPSVVGREGVSEVIWPAMTADETQGLERSAATLKNAVGNYWARAEACLERSRGPHDTRSG